MKLKWQTLADDTPDWGAPVWFSRPTRKDRTPALVTMSFFSYYDRTMWKHAENHEPFRPRRSDQWAYPVAPKPPTVPTE